MELNKGLDELKTGSVLCIEGNEFKGIPTFEVSDVEFHNDVHDYLVDHITSIANENSIEFTCHLDLFDLYNIIGLYQWVIDNCSNRRVIHLIKYGKNIKIRKKNFNRAIRIIVKDICT